MQTVDELHRLVHSLTSWEKRTFTMHARRSGRNPLYLKLFNALDRIESYDAAVVRKAFKGMLAERNLNELRYALLEELVVSLDRRQSTEDVVARLTHEVEAIEFLAERGCIATAERRLRKARASARTYELPSALLALCAVQRRSMPLTPSLQKTLMEDEEFALMLANDHHEAARVLHEWTQCATTSARFEVSALGGPLHMPPTATLLPNKTSSLSVLGTLRRLHASILASGCLRDADAMIGHVHAMSCLLAEHKQELTAYVADVHNALADIESEAALLGITSRLAGLILPSLPVQTEVMHQRVAATMRAALQELRSGNLDGASRMTSAVLNDAELGQAHEAWSAQATLIWAALQKIAGHNRLLTHFVRSAIRTAQRRSRFTEEELTFLKILQKPEQMTPAAFDTQAVQRTAVERAVLQPDAILALLYATLQQHQPVSVSVSVSRSARSASKYVLRVGRYRK